MIKWFSGFVWLTDFFLSLFDFNTISNDKGHNDPSKVTIHFKATFNLYIKLLNLHQFIQLYSKINNGSLSTNALDVMKHFYIILKKIKISYRYSASWQTHSSIFQIVIMLTCHGQFFTTKEHWMWLENTKDIFLMSKVSLENMITFLRYIYSTLQKFYEKIALVQTLYGRSIILLCWLIKQ